MSVIHAGGISVRHAVARALATVNRSPMEATWRVLAARASVDGKGRVVSAELSLRVEEPRPLDRETPVGLVNPDGNHPLMAQVPGHPGVLMDVIPVTLERWTRTMGGPLPPNHDPWCPRTAVDRGQAEAYARAVGKRLPDVEEYRAAWGLGRFPWGDAVDAALGRAAPPRFGELPEVALHPPGRTGFFDLGAWLWHWTADGELLGAAPGLVPGPPNGEPIGFRCVVEP